jgi:chromosome segregation ATPase
MWAIVTNDSAAVYDSAGNLAQELAAGTLVEVAALRQGNTESLAICRYDTRPTGMEVAIIRARDLLVRKGSLESANADLLTLLRKQVQIEGEIRALSSTRDDEMARRNPHTQEYMNARSAVLSFNESAKALRARADRASGSSRVEVMDKLRSMKEEEAALRRRYDAARRAFEEWNSRNGESGGESEPLKVLRQRLADVRQQVGRMDTR